MLEIAVQFAFGGLAAYGAWMLTLRMGVAALDWYGRREQERYDAMRAAKEGREVVDTMYAQYLEDREAIKRIIHDSQTESA